MLSPAQGVRQGSPASSAGAIITYPSSCLSKEPHDDRISDVTLHFSGCLPIAKRRRFFENLPLASQQRIRRDHDKIQHLRQKLDGPLQDSSAAACLRSFKQAMGQWHEAHGRPSPYGSGGGYPHSRTASSLAHYYAALENDIDADINASVIFFKDSQPYDVPGLPRSFPNQKMSVRDLLDDADPARNPLMQPCPKDEVHYFHLPANNMLWVEEAVARYYHEKRPSSDDFLLTSKLFRRERTRTEMLLRPEVWQGQRNYDGEAEVHARHMRPFCDLVSIGAYLPTCLPTLPYSFSLCPQSSGLGSC